MTKRLLSGLAVMAIAGAALAGCAPQTPAAPAETDPIVIGAEVPLTGALASPGNALADGYQLAVDDINAEGGIDGREVQLLIEDNQGDPAVSGNLVKKFATSDDVDAILGGYGSGPALVSSQTAEQYGIPNIQPFASAPEMIERGFKYLFNTFRIFSNIETDVNKFILDKVDPKTVSIVYIDSPFAIAGAEAAKAAYEKAGVEVVVFEKVPTGESNYSAAIGKVEEADADVLELIVYPPDDLVMMKDISQRQYAPQLIHVASDVHEQQAVLDGLGAAADWVISTPDWFVGAPIPQAQDLEAKWNDKFGENPQIAAIKGYQAAQILFDAIERAGTTDKDAVRDALLATDLETVGGHVKFDQSNGQAIIPTLIVQLQDLKPVGLAPEEFAQGEWKPFPAWSDR